MERTEALQLLMKYNKDRFHIQHGITVAEIMEYFSVATGNEKDREKWYLTGLLHDIDYEMYPSEHCIKAREILEENGFDEEIIRAVTSHAFGMSGSNLPEPLSMMERVLFAVDELSGLIGAAALMRPSKSTKDMELSSLKKKFKDKRFAAGCDRDVIRAGADRLGWELDRLLNDTLSAIKDREDNIQNQMRSR